MKRRKKKNKKVKVKQEDFCSIFHIIQKIEKAFNRRDWWFVVYFIVILSFHVLPDRLFNN